MQIDRRARAQLPEIDAVPMLRTPGHFIHPRETQSCREPIPASLREGPDQIWPRPQFLKHPEHSLYLNKQQTGQGKELGAAGGSKGLP